MRILIDNFNALLGVSNMLYFWSNSKISKNIKLFEVSFIAHG